MLEDSVTETAGQTNDPQVQTADGTILFAEADLSDVNSINKTFVSAVWTKANTTTANIGEVGDRWRSPR